MGALKREMILSSITGSFEGIAATCCDVVARSVSSLCGVLLTYAASGVIGFRKSAEQHKDKDTHTDLRPYFFCMVVRETFKLQTQRGAAQEGSI